MPLATLADLKLYVGLKADDTSADVILTNVLEYASTAFENSVQRSIARGARSELRSGNGSDRMLLRDFPIVSIESLTIDGLPVPAAVGIGNGYVFTTGNEEAAIYLRGYRFTLGVKNIAIAYTAGFDPVPADVGHAIVEVSAQAWKEKDWIGFISKALAGETVTFAREGFPNSAKRIVADYARRWPCD